jgi:hypothetical protein
VESVSPANAGEGTGPVALWKELGCAVGCANAVRKCSGAIVSRAFKVFVVQARPSARR